MSETLNRPHCGHWLDDEPRRCGAVADFILWGKLFPKDALGPRCREHAELWTRTDAWTLSQSAIYDLRPVGPLLAELEKFKPQPMSQQCRDGLHGGEGDWKCHNCHCLCHTHEERLDQADADFKDLDHRWSERFRQQTAEIERLREINRLLVRDYNHVLPLLPDQRIRDAHDFWCDAPKCAGPCNCELPARVTEDELRSELAAAQARAEAARVALREARPYVEMHAVTVKRHTLDLADLVGFLLARIAEDEMTTNFVLANSDLSEQPAELVGSPYDPRRVLAECEAKRRIIEELGPPHFLTGGSSAAYRMVLRLLALPYADHPDYRDEWRAE